MIRPWYRSLLFWLGVPGLVFLGWAWLAFVQDLAEVSWTTDAGRIAIGSGDGEFFSEITRPSREEWSNGFSVETERNFWDGEGKVWTRQPFGAERKHWESNRIKLQTIDLWMAGWFACLFYLIAWLGATTWWQRRKSQSTSG